MANAWKDVKKLCRELDCKLESAGRGGGSSNRIVLPNGRTITCPRSPKGTQIVKELRRKIERAMDEEDPRSQ